MNTSCNHAPAPALLAMGQASIRSPVRALPPLRSGPKGIVCRIVKRPLLRSSLVLNVIKATGTRNHQWRDTARRSDRARRHADSCRTRSSSSYTSLLPVGTGGRLSLRARGALSQRFGVPVELRGRRARTAFQHSCACVTTRGRNVPSDRDG
jgi:hypothetical protein